MSRCEGVKKAARRNSDQTTPALEVKRAGSHATKGETSHRLFRQEMVEGVLLKPGFPVIPAASSFERAMHQLTF